MSLVEYSSSSEEQSDTAEYPSIVHSVCGKRKKLTKLPAISPKQSKVFDTSEEQCHRLPLPAEVVSMFSSNDADNHADNPSIHGGRIRSFAHERGNWASLVYIPFVCEWIDELNRDLIRCLKHCAEFQPIEDLHISLSKTFVLRHHCIDPLVADLQQAVALCRTGVVRFSEVEFYCNEEQARDTMKFCCDLILGCNGVINFISESFQAHSEGNLLESFVKAIDSCLCQYGLPIYYKNPSFHVSLTWCLGDARNSIDKSTMATLQNLVLKFLAENMEASCINVKELVMKTGNKIHVLPLG